MIDITDLDPAAVLAALYNASQPLGRGYLQYKPGDMPVEEARKLLSVGNNCFEYLHGRVMKVNIPVKHPQSSFSNRILLDTGLYDYNNGEGAAEEAIFTVQLEEENKKFGKE